jgi:DNA-binding IclR family transcriptional regulator
MGLLDRARVLYVYRLHGHRAGQYEADGSLRAGAYIPAHSTIIGKALLASLIESEFRSLLSTMCSNTERGTATSLADEVEPVRLKGSASGDDHTPRARSVAAPVMRRLDKPILAVQITVPAGSCPRDDLLAHFGGPVRHAANLLSA